MRRIDLALLCVALLLLTQAELAHAGGVGVSSPPEAPLAPPIEAAFTHYRPGALGSRMRRDLEFQWSMLYTQALGQSQMTVNEQLTLDQLGTTLIERQSNPLGIPVPDIQLVYDYFRPFEYPTFVPYFYNPSNPIQRSGFVLGDSVENSQPIPRAERDHADVYIFPPGQSNEFAGHYPSNFISANEDFSTSGCTSPGCVRNKNSLSFPGPSLSNFIDLAGTGWTRPDSSANWQFCHEFEHGLRSFLIQGLPGAAIDEMFGSAAEAISGERDQTAIREVPFTWSLLGFNPSSACDPPNPECVRTVDRNYAAWRLFTAYLAYNFRGQDQSATLAGIQDDLLRRWATAQFGRTLLGLESLLNDAECSNCPGYFSGLDDASRIALLLHNWRVANYVNRSDLPGTEGQYGYPAQFGFTPRKDVGAWQDLDGLAWDNIVSIPPEIVLDASHLTREEKRFGERATPENTYPMTLQPLGAEYWVVRADPSLVQPGVDLVVHVAAESVFSCSNTLDGRLVASVVGYLPPAAEVLTGDLSANPDWALHATAPQWVDVDSLSQALEVVLPGFGTTYKAALVAISLVDGPRRGLASATSTSYIEAVPYRMSLALRTSPFQMQNPQLAQDSNDSDSEPTWSPAGDELAFTVTDGTNSQIYRRKLDGSPPVLLVDNGLSQFAPAWSPRGDQVVLTQGSPGPSLGDLYLLNLASSQLLKLTGNSGNEVCAVFRPDGQSLAYLHQPAPPEGPWSLRRIDVNGNNDALVYQAASPLGSPRWAPDGARIFFVEGLTLRSIKADGTDLRNEPFSRSVLTFDMHPTGDSLAIAEPGVTPVTGGGCEAPPTPSLEQPFQRLLIYDPLGNGNPAVWDDPVRFYRTGALFSDPRWSPEGTRVAYVSDQNGGADPDIFVGQVSYNHAPTFAPAPGDTFVPNGQTLTIDLNATDPDGETVTYDAAFLPAGSTFDPMTGVFTWANPCDTAYVVFHAKDASGAVASVVVRIADELPGAVSDIAPDLVGPTSVSLAWTAPGEDGAFGLASEYDLRFAPFPITASNFHIAARDIDVTAPLAPPSSEFWTVDGLQKNTWYWFALKTRDPCGHWSEMSYVASAKTLGTGGGPLSARVSGDDDSAGGGGEESTLNASAAVARAASATSGEPPTTGLHALALEKAWDGDVPVWRLYQMDGGAVAEASPEAAIAIQSRNGAGAWTHRGGITPEGGVESWSVRLPRKVDERMLFVGDYSLAAVADAVEPAVAGASVQVSGAYQTGGASVLETLLADPGSVFTTTSDTLKITYEPLAGDPGGSNWYFVVVGSPDTRPAGSARGQREIAEAERDPEVFRLLPVSPNPAAGLATVRFELPRPSRVRMHVFDLAGRRVATLADGPFEAGRHELRWNVRSRGLGAGVYFCAVDLDGQRTAVTRFAVLD